jgi:hypothetical protein
MANDQNHEMISVVSGVKKRTEMYMFILLYSKSLNKKSV